MRQLILVAPEDATTENILNVLELNNEQFVYGLPIVLFPGWKYELIDISEPESRIVKAKPIEDHDGCKGCKHEMVAPTDPPCDTCKQNFMDNYELDFAKDNK